MCLVGFQKTNQNAIFRWGWPITWFPLGSNTKHQTYPLCFPSLIRTSKHFPVTQSAESMDMLLSVSSFFHKELDLFFLCFLHCRPSHIFGSRWRGKQKGSPVSHFICTTSQMGAEGTPGLWQEVGPQRSITHSRAHGGSRSETSTQNLVLGIQWFLTASYWSMFSCSYWGHTWGNHLVQLWLRW